MFDLLCPLRVVSVLRVSQCGESGLPVYQSCTTVLVRYDANECVSGMYVPSILTMRVLQLHEWSIERSIHLARR